MKNPGPICGKAAVLILLIFSLYCCSKESHSDDNLVSVQKSAVITAARGGEIELSNPDGDKVTLIIPGYALEDSLKITLQLLNKIEKNPFSKNIINTIRILPEGLKLKKAARIRIIFGSKQVNSSMTMLYYGKEPDLSYPLNKIDVTGNSITSETYHFSDFGCAEPTRGEIISQSVKMRTDPGGDIWNWQGFFGYVKGMLQYIAQLELLGDEDISAELRQIMEERIIDRVNAFLNLPVPDEPCGHYQLALFKYGELIMTIADDEQLLERVQNRMNEIRNRCLVRGEIEYAHDYTYNVAGGTIHRTITGFVPFTVNTLIEPYGEISGGGTVDWNGTQSTGQGSGIETGTGTVVLEGELEADESGEAWLNFRIHETWSGSVTYLGQITYPFNPPPSDFEVRFLMEDGYIVLRPVPGGPTGSFKWILHLQI